MNNYIILCHRALANMYHPPVRQQCWVKKTLKFTMKMFLNTANLFILRHTYRPTYYLNNVRGSLQGELKKQNFVVPLL